MNRVQLLPRLAVNIQDAVNSRMTTMNGMTIRLEASSMCQLRCPACDNGRGTLRHTVVGWGWLRFDDFKKFVDKNPNIKNIELSNHGEMFLNPELDRIMEYAQRKGIILTAWNGVNLNTVSEKTLENLVKYKFQHLSVAIDGVTNKTYQIYRINGDLNRVIDNIKKINYYKRTYRSRYPRLCWQYILFGHNEHEVVRAKRMARKLGMEFRPKLNWSSSYAKVRSEALVRRLSGLGVASRKEFLERYHREYTLVCMELWNLPKINWDGRLLGCCVNRIGDYGNVFKSGLSQCLQSERYQHAKRMLLGEVSARDDIPCSRCAVYRNKLPRKSLRHLKIMNLLEKRGIRLNYNLSKILFMGNT
jgi:MoaA/NifB/PqqE/SkfB family radical SAM enzyme